MSHLQFADDTLIMCSDFYRQIWLLRCVLRCFEAISGLKVNFAKSFLIMVDEVTNIDMLTTELGCKVGHLPYVYLGLPLELLLERKMFGIQ